MIKIIQAHQTKILIAFIGILFAVFCFFLLYRLGAHPFIDWDESIYAQVAKESFQHNRFFDFTYFGQVWYEKPPLAFWLMSAMYAVGGVSEWTARVPSALAAIAVVILSLRWVWEIRKSYTATILTMASYFIMFPFITAAYFVNLDTVVGFFVLLALYAWWKAIQKDEQNQNWFIVRGVAIGLGVLSKNIVGLFPIIPMLIYAAIQRDFSFFKERKFWYGILAAVLIIAPWHIYQSVVSGQAFWDNYLIYHVFDRFGGNLENNAAPFLYFFQIVFQRYMVDTVVFGGSILISIWLAWKNLSVRYLLVCSVVLFLIFSSSTTKLPSYITVVLPLIVMLAGISIGKIIDYIPRVWMRVIVVLVLTASFVYTGYAFNAYKLAQGEFSEEYSDNKAVGEFLKDYRRDLPVYINAPYKSLGIGFYAERPIIPTEDKALIDGAPGRVFRKHSEAVYLGPDYLIIVR
jgi:4-amino-4-deoxy-L-arabinose transferase-like glycosyltransferase